MRAIVLVCAALTCSATRARAQSPTGSIEGVIVDQSHAPLAGVTVTIHSETTGIERVVQTDSSGLFRAPLLAVGTYELGAALDGFQPLKRAGIELTVGETIGLRLELTIADVVETVTVSSAAPVFEPGRSKASSVVDDFAIQHLPVNGRNFVDFALLTPGATRDSGTGDLSFAGQRSMFNSLIVDGADDNNTFFAQSLGRVGSGRAPYQFSEDAVKEFQVNSNAYSAEYGRAGAAVINVVTKSGTNSLSGSAFEFYRDKALNATNVINLQNGQPKSPYHYHQFGGTTGGPLRANRDFFFLNVEAQRNTSPNVTFLNLPANLPNDPLTAAGVALLEPLASSWTRSLDQNVFLVRTDHKAGDGNVTLRYNHQDFAGENFESGGPQVALEHSGTSRVETRTLNGSWVSTVRGNLLNELKVQYARDDEPGSANSANPEAIIQQSGATVFIIGRNNFSPRATNLDRVQAADTVTWTRGPHQVKAGVDVQADNIHNFFPQYFSGSYNFRSLASFALGRPNQPGEFYQQTFAGAGTGGPFTPIDVREYAAFAQDSWQAHRDLTLNIGLRYDLMIISPPAGTNPDPQLAAANIDTGRVNTDVNNVGPRLGLAWNPGGGSYVIRGGWGVFYGRTPALRISSSANNGINVVALTFTGNDVPTYPQSFSSIPTTGTAAKPNVFYVDQQFSSPRMTQANGAVEWQWRGTTMTATYLFVDGAMLPHSVDRNIGTESFRTFTIAGTGQTVTYPFFGPDRPFTNFNRVIALESTAASRYNGLTLEMNRRFTRGFQFRAAYTLGRVIDTLPDGSIDDAQFASNPNDSEADRAAGNSDQRQRFVANGVFMPPGTQRGGGVAQALTRDWSFSGIVTAESGKPYSARVIGIDLNNDGNPRNDRAPGTQRNAFRLPAIVTVDARVAREIPVAGRVRTQLFCEAFNLFNRANINGVVPGYYSLAGTTLTPTTTFGRPNTSAGERILQLAIRVMF